MNHKQGSLVLSLQAEPYRVSAVKNIFPIRSKETAKLLVFQSQNKLLAPGFAMKVEPQVTREMWKEKYTGTMNTCVGVRPS